MLQFGQPQTKEEQAKNLSDSHLYIIAGCVALIGAFIAALIVALFSGESGWRIGLQVTIAALVYGFTVISDPLTKQGKLNDKQWLSMAAVCAILIYSGSFLTNSFLNVLLAPLLVGLSQRLKDNRRLIYSAGAAILLIFLQIFAFWLIGWDKFDNVNNGTVSTIMVISSIALSLTTFVKSNRTEIDSYRLELENKASEMEVAHEIQTSLMAPSEIVTGNWNMAARSIPAKDVGGDFYEYIPYLDKGIGGIAIGDVAGKGIPAALQMAVVRTLFRVEARRRIFPAETLISVNMALQAERSFGMVTMLYAFVDPATSVLHVANAGHNFPIILNGTIEEIHLPGLPLGIDDDVEYEEKAVKLLPGTSVILYTDGVVEAMNDEGEMYGFDNFSDAIMRFKDLDPRPMVDAILREIAEFTQNAPQSDDITVLVLQHQKIEGGLDPEIPTELPLVTAAVSATQSSSDDDDGFNWI